MTPNHITTLLLDCHLLSAQRKDVNCEINVTEHQDPEKALRYEWLVNDLIIALQQEATGAFAHRQLLVHSSLCYSNMQ